MKNTLFVIGILTNYFNSFGQDAKEILQQTYNKCQSVKSGYYEMSKQMKYMSGKDTTRSSYFCHFKELKHDSLYSSTFHYKEFKEDNYRGDVIYTGDELVLTYTRDSTATIMSKLRWASKIKAYRNNFTFYTPLVNRKDSYLQHDSDFINNRNIFKFIGIENLKGMICYHVQVNKIPKIDTTEALKTLREEYHYWIKKEDSIPVQYTLAFDVEMNNDTMYQYEKFVLNHYELNNLKDEKIISLNSIPSYYTTKDFVPYKSPEL